MNIYTGVVEDINDPAEMNRLRVRVYGKHNQNKAELPTGALAWSSVLLPFQASTLNITQGQWVMGVFVDPPELEQEFMVLGMISSRLCSKRLFCSFLSKIKISWPFLEK